ncbi:presenilin-1-like [Dermacentor albipictus]|uniref:presenilin-1-like n=1 Tax=Dermacentor albipictus TaxID=60249 RepID=UPI0031FD5B7C
MDRDGRLSPRSASPFTAQQYERLGNQATTLVVAVSVCMLSVAALVRIMPYTKRSLFEVTYVSHTNKGVGPEGEPGLFINAFANAFVFLLVIMIANWALVFLYKGGHYYVVRAWLMTGSALLLFLAGYYYAGRVLFFLGVPADHFSCALVTWNVGILGVVALYCDAPCLMQRCYLVYVSILMAIAIEEVFPNWTSWILLVLVSLWDLFTVLCVQGPTRILIETAKERNDSLFPALVFSTSSAWCYEIALSAVETSRHGAATTGRSSISRKRFPSHLTLGYRSGMRRSFNTRAPCAMPAIPRHAIGTPRYPRGLERATPTPASALLFNEHAPNSCSEARTTTEYNNIARPEENAYNGVTASAFQPCLVPAISGQPDATTTQVAVTTCSDHAGDAHKDGSSPGRSSVGGRWRRGGRRHEFSLAPSCNSEDSFGIPSGAGSGCSTPAKRRLGSPRPGLKPEAPPPGSSPPLEQGRGRSKDVLEHGLKLGLGDFIFYSILLGKASRHGTVVGIVACYISVLVGVLLTVALLVIFRKPVPALPLCILMGLAAYFTSAIVCDPFLEAIDFNFY